MKKGIKVFGVVLVVVLLAGTVWADTRTYPFSNSNNYSVSNSELIQVNTGTGMAELRTWECASDNDTLVLLHLNNNVTDSSPQALTVSNTGVTFAAGRFSQAGDFEKDESDFLQVSHNSLLEFATGDTVTWEAWINPESLVSSPTMYFMRKAKTGPLFISWAFGTYGNGRLYFVYRDSTGSHCDYQTAAGTITAGSWQHIAFTYTFGTGTSAQFWKNGQAVSGSWLTGTGNNGPTGTLSQIRFGASESGEYYDGLMDEVRISKVTRISSSVWDLPSVPSPRAPYVRSAQTYGQAYLNFDAQATPYAETLGGGSTGSVRYRVSKDGTTWYYYSGSWTSAGGETAAYSSATTNTAAELNTNLPTFDNQVGSGTFYLQAFLISDGQQLPLLDAMTIQYTPNPSTPSIASVSGGSGGGASIYVNGDTATIAGTNFGALQGASVVKFAGTDAGIASSWTDTEIQINVPNNVASGNVIVRVGSLDSNGYAYTVGTPGITTVSPAPPTTVFNQETIVVTGSSFGHVRGNSSVSVGGTTAASGDYKSWSNTSVTLLVPAGVSGTGTQRVIVTTQGGSSADVSNDDCEIGADPNTYPFTTPANYYSSATTGLSRLEVTGGNAELTRTTYTCSTDPNTVLLVHLDETSGTTCTAYDYTCGTYTGTYTNGPSLNQTSLAANFGTAVRFDGSNDFIEFTHRATFNSNSGSITLEAWIKPSNLVGQHRIISKPVPSTGYENYSIQTVGAKLLFTYRDTGNGLHEFYTNGSILQENVWQHVALTHTWGNASSTKWYLNATVTPSTWNTGTGAATPKTNANPLYIGVTDMGGGTYFFNGLIDEARISMSYVSSSGFNSRYLTTSPYVETISASENAAFSTGELTEFQEILGAGFTEQLFVNELRYNLSNDDGTTWYYYNGSTWVDAGAATTISNAIPDITVNSGINTFPGTGGRLRIRAFFRSDGSTLVRLNSVHVSRVNLRHQNDTIFNDSDTPANAASVARGETCTVSLDVKNLLASGDTARLTRNSSLEFTDGSKTWKAYLDTQTDIAANATGTLSFGSSTPSGATGGVQVDPNFVAGTYTPKLVLVGTSPPGGKSFNLTDVPTQGFSTFQDSVVVSDPNVVVTYKATTLADNTDPTGDDIDPDSPTGTRRTHKAAHAWYTLTVENRGDAITLTGNTYFTFNDGTNQFKAYLKKSGGVYPSIADGNVTPQEAVLTFDSLDATGVGTDGSGLISDFIVDAFAVGTYQPTLYVEGVTQTGGIVFTKPNVRTNGNAQLELVELDVALAVELSGFDGQAGDGEALLTWETQSEIQNLGFNLYRSTSADRGYRQINEGLIVGLGTTTIGGRYWFRDRDLQNGTRYYYLLEDVDLSTRTDLHGPVSVTPAVGVSFAFDPDRYTAGAESTGWIGPDPVIVPIDGPVADGGDVVAPAGLGQRLGADATRIDTLDGDVILVIRPPKPEVRSLEVGGEKVWRVVVPGYGHTSEVGRPRVPTKGLLVETPGVEDASVEIIETVKHGSQRLLRPEREAGFDTVFGDGGDDEADVDGTGVRFRRREVPPAAAVDRAIGGTAIDRLKERLDRRGIRGGQASRPYPVAPIQHGGFVREGSRQFLRVVVNPAIYDEAGRTLTAYREITVRIRWKGRPVEPAAQPTDGAEATSRLARGTAVKVLVRGDGPTRIRAEDLLAAGFDPGTPTGLRLHDRGEEIAVRVVGAEDGALDPGDAIEFYGEARPDLYTDTNVYWLVAGDGAGVRMGDRDADPTDVPVAAVPATVARRRFEVDRNYFSTLDGPAERDRWMWSHAYATRTRPGTVALDLSLDRVADLEGTAVLSYVLAGITDDPDTQTDHHTVVRLNGVAVDDVRWSGEATLDRSVQVPQSLLVPGTNAFVLEVPGDAGPSVDGVAVDRISLAWWRPFVALDDALDFEVEGAGAYALAGFSVADVAVWDVTEDDRPEILTGLEAVAEADGTWTLHGALRPGRYVARAAGAVPAAEVRPDTPSNLRDTGRHVDYILLTTGPLLETARAFADHRQAGGLDVLLVDVEDVYDEFSNGRETPEAIRAFVSYAYHAWPPPAPRYLLLAGDASYDYRNFLGRNQPDPYVPTRMTPTETFAAADDNWFVTVAGDDLVPDLAVGRVPAATPEELALWVRKTLEYEAAPDDPWMQRAVLLADDDEEGTYGRFADQLAGLMTGMSALRMDVDPADPVGTRTRFIDAFNRGALLVDYTGHGGIAVWAKEQVFRSEDVALLTNAGRLPLVVAANCLSGLYTSVYTRSLSEALLFDAGAGGAVAVWSPSGSPRASGQQIVTAEFTRLLFQAGETELGAAIVAAKRVLAAHSASRPDYADGLNTYTLFGDPALRLRR